MSGWATPSVNPPATPASTALPPAVSTLARPRGERVAGGHGPASADRLDGRGRTVDGRAELGRRGV
jgi:hypothetical protein